jgi:hypothetical protein
MPGYNVSHVLACRTKSPRPAVSITFMRRREALSTLRRNDHRVLAEALEFEVSWPFAYTGWRRWSLNHCATVAVLCIVSTIWRKPTPVLYAQNETSPSSRTVWDDAHLRAPEIVVEEIVGLQQVFAKKPDLGGPREGLHTLHPRPTHLHGPTLFARMYLDRVLTTIAVLLTAFGAALFAPHLLGWTLGAYAGAPVRLRAKTPRSPTRKNASDG